MKNIRSQPEVSFHWEKGQTPPGEIKDLKLEDDVVVTLHGKVRSIRKDEWGSGLGVSMGKVEIVPQKEKPKGVGEAMELMKGQRRV